MNGYSEDLRRRIVLAVERAGCPRPKSGSHLRCEPLFGQTLYEESPPREIAGTEEKSPGSFRKLDEKASKLLLQGDLEENAPLPSLQDRRDYIEALTGLSVSSSTMCRAIARVGSTRNKGDESPPSATSSEGELGG